MCRSRASPSLNSVRQGITVVVTVNPSSLWHRVTRGPGSSPSSAAAVAAGRSPDQYYLGYGKRGQTLFYKWHVGLTADLKSAYTHCQKAPLHRKPTVGFRLPAPTMP